MVISTRWSHVLLLSIWILTASTIKGTTHNSPETKPQHFESGSSTSETEKHRYVRGKKLLLGAMAVHQLLWFGPNEAYHSIKAEFRKLERAKSWNPLRWFISSKGKSWDQELLKAFDIMEDPEALDEKQIIHKYLKAAYESVPFSEKAFGAKDVYVVYRKILKVYANIILTSDIDYIRTELTLSMEREPESEFHTINMRDYLDSEKLRRYEYAISPPKESIVAMASYFFAKYGCNTVVSMTRAMTANFQRIIDIVLKMLNSVMDMKGKGSRDSHSIMEWTKQSETIDTLLPGFIEKTELVDVFATELLGKPKTYGFLDNECDAHSKHASHVLQALNTTTLQIYRFVRNNRKYFSYRSRLANFFNIY